MEEVVAKCALGHGTIEIAPPDSYVALDTALQQILSYDWLVLTSANAVGAIVERARHLSIPITNLSAVFIAAIGNATADALTRLGLAVEVTPPQAVAESLAAALSPRVKGKLVLLIRAKVARDVLPEALETAGADVTIVEAYQTIIPVQSIEALRLALTRQMDAVTFTSASSVHNLAALALAAGSVIPQSLKKITIGPITTQALAQHGWTADAEAATASVDSLVEAVIVACR